MLHFRIGGERQKGHMANGRGGSVYWVSESVILKSKRAPNNLCQIFSSRSMRTLYYLSPFHSWQNVSLGEKRRGLSTLSTIGKIFYPAQKLIYAHLPNIFPKSGTGFIWTFRGEGHVPRLTHYYALKMHLGLKRNTL